MKKLSPLESIMTTINDCASDIQITSAWIGDPQYGSLSQTHALLESYVVKLRDAYNQLKELTGADPCK